MTNLETGTRSLFLEIPGKSLYQFRWSPDSRWIVFQAENSKQYVGHSTLYVAPFTGDDGPSETAWIPITDGSTKEELPRWSSDGNSIYALSNRDGFDCIWADSCRSSNQAAEWTSGRGLSLAWLAAVAAQREPDLAGVVRCHEQNRVQSRRDHR